MKKFSAILISLVLTAAFAGSVYYGFTHSRGVPVKIEKITTPVVEAPFIDKAIDKRGHLPGYMEPAQTSGNQAYVSGYRFALAEGKGRPAFYYGKGLS